MTKRSGNNKPSSLIIRCVVSCIQSSYNNIVDVHGRKYVLGPTQAHFSPSVARAKMSAEKGPKHIYAEEHQLYYYYYNFEEHLVQKQEHFAISETRMTRWLRPAGSNMLEPAKMFIRARIIRHNARQSYNNILFELSNDTRTAINTQGHSSSCTPIPVF